MKQILVFSCIICMLCSCAAQSTTRMKVPKAYTFAGKYKEYLAEGEAEIKTKYHFMESRKADGKYILRRFLPESKKLIFYAEAKDEEFKILDGAMKVWYYEGGIAEEYQYKDGQLNGLARKYSQDTLVVISESNYINGKLDGLKSKFNNEGKLTSSASYKDGLLDGYSISYDSSGAVKHKCLYQRDKAIDDCVLETEGAKCAEIMPTLAEFSDIKDYTARKCKSDEALLKYVFKNLKYPQDDQICSVEGKVEISFVVDENGLLVNFRILHSPTIAMAEEVKRVITLLPKWSPGSQYGKVVRVQYNLPIKFKLK